MIRAIYRRAVFDFCSRRLTNFWAGFLGRFFGQVFWAGFAQANQVLGRFCAG